MDKNIGRVEETLLERKRAVAGVLAHLEKEGAEFAEGRQVDWLDRAWDDSAARTIERLTEIYRSELDAIERALARIRAGVFGACAACHDPIPAARFAIFPQTRFCAACAGVREAFERAA